ncbi:MAG: PadR family transcriptional regulator [Oscillospiraceae bacterium]|nr:PadR family transcriptional regulator [Oscillospiraceae bacterium]
MADKNYTPLTEAVYYILLSVTEPMHGYGIIQNVKEKSSGRLVLAAGTLYGAITNLLAKGWIETINEDAASRKKDYIITSDGLAVLKAELERLEELVKNGQEIIER